MSGKTTTAAILAERSPRAAHLEADRFFAFIQSGYVEPWKPESQEQNEVVMGIVARAAAGYTDGGYLTIVDGIVIPAWFLRPLREALETAGHRVAYAVLRPRRRSASSGRKNGKARSSPIPTSSASSGRASPTSETSSRTRSSSATRAPRRWRTSFTPASGRARWRSEPRPFYSTTSVPSIPASRWPGTEQKYVYLPGFRPFSVTLSEPSVIDFGLADVFAARGFHVDVMADRLRVVEVDRHVTGLGGHFFLGVGEGAARVRFDFDARGFSARGFSAGFRFARRRAA